MKIDEAIKIKCRWRKDNYPPALADEMNADMLSIEALKFIELERVAKMGFYHNILPGETEI